MLILLLWSITFGAFFFQWLSLNTAYFSVESTSESLDCPCSSYSFNFSSLEVLYYCILLVSLETDAECLGRGGLMESRFGHGTVLEDLLSIVGRQAQISAIVIGKNEFNWRLPLFVHYKLSMQTGAIASAERKPGGKVKTAYPDEGWALESTAACGAVPSRTRMKAKHQAESTEEEVRWHAVLCALIAADHCSRAGL